MTVNEIYLDGFRNYNDVTAKFCAGVNVIVGRNAQGKTNLLEAINFIATGRSFKTVSDKDLIKFDNGSAYIKAMVESSERCQKLEARITYGKRKQFFANDVKLKKIAELSGRLTTVLFCPDDLSLIKDGASVRRKFMDNCLSQLRPGYLTALLEFNKLYENKTRILKNHFDKPALLDLLDDFNLRLAERSAKLIYYRSAFCESLTRRAAEIHGEFSSGCENLEISYKTVGNLDATGKKASEILPFILEHQKEHRGAELKSGLCLTGAHKDDFEVAINDVSARKFSSQGQTRTAAISLKLAERDIQYDDRGEYPVLLLDDVLSELDEKRQAFVLERIKRGQVIITCCEDTSSVPIPNCGETIKVENGKVV